LSTWPSKGTSQIGTTDYAAEKVALAKVEDANDAYEAEYLKAVVATRQAGRAEGKPSWQPRPRRKKFVVPNQFTDVAERNGAEGLNAATASTIPPNFCVDARESSGALGLA